MKRLIAAVAIGALAAISAVAEPLNITVEHAWAMLRGGAICRARRSCLEERS